MNINYKLLINILFVIITVSIVILYSFFKSTSIPDYWNINSIDNWDWNIEYITNKWSYTLKKMEEYNINSLIILKKSYINNDNGDLIPFDFVLWWDKMINKDNLSYISFSQSQRWYYYKINDIKKLNIPYNEVWLMTANTHIIPETEYIFKELSKLEEWDKVELKWYLVNIKDNKTWYMLKTSLSRSDTGAWACEIFYIKEIIKK